MKKAISATVLGGIAFVVVGCLSSVSYLRYKPATMDMTNYKRIGVLHTSIDGNFGAVSTSPYYLANLFSYRHINKDYKTQLTQQQLISYADEAMEQSLHQTGYFTVVDINSKNHIYNLTMTNSQIGQLYDVDAIIIGTISSLYWNDRSYSETHVEYDANNVPISTLKEKVERSYHLTLSYQIVETSSGAIIYSKIFNHSTSDNDSYGDSSSLSLPSDIFYSMVDSDIRTMTRLLVPYQVRQKVKLLFNSTYNNEFAIANKAVRSQSHQQAMDIYMNLWNQHQVPQALYNASIVYELKTDLDSAYQAMQILYQQSPKSKYKKRLEHLKAISDEQRLVLKQLH